MFGETPTVEYADFCARPGFLCMSSRLLISHKKCFLQSLEKTRYGPGLLSALHRTAQSSGILLRP